jgi:membrane associated rhomboid family serine protease
VYWTFGYIPAKPSLLGLFTSMFLHGGWLHLLGNMLFLWLAGGSLEDRWGRVCFSVFYLASGVVAALIHAAMIPQSNVPMIGASGAIAGLMGAFLIRLATTRIRFFYWFIFFRGTFIMPAYVALPLWLLQQFAMARSGAAGGIAVWAHIGGFIFGAVIALAIRLSGLEAKILAPAITRKTSWSASDQLTAALGMLDKGDVDGGIHALVAILKKSPNSIETRAALASAYTQKGDSASASRESARLVSAYVAGRDMEGALAALEEHRHAHPGVAPPMRSLLALAGYREKQGRHAEAAELYQRAIQAWPDDLLGPKALVAYGRLLLEVFQDPSAALEILEQVRTHPKVMPEFQKASEELIAKAERDRPAAAPEAAATPVPTPEPALATVPEQPSFDRFEHSFGVGAPRVEDAAPQAAGQDEPPPAASPASSTVEPAPEAPADALTVRLPMDEIMPPPATCRLAPTPMQAVAIDARGLRLKSHAGAAGILQWQQIVGLSVARIEDSAELSEDHLVLDLLMAPESTPDGEVVRCVRLSEQDLAIPQLQNEASRVRGFQRFVATALKASGAITYPSRDDCLGARGFRTFPDLTAYEAALLSSLA